MLVLLYTSVNAQSTYCSANLSSGWDWEFIESVSFGAINNSSGFAAGGYYDYTSLTTPILQGSAMPLVVTVNLASSSDSVRVYIDWNNDFIFDPLTEAYHLTFDGFFTFSANPVMPTGVPTGTYRMRVVLVDTFYDNIAPCGGFTYGEIEDYTIEVSASGCAISAAFSYIQVGYFDMQFSLGLPVFTTGGDYYVDWTFGDNTSAFDQNVVTHTYASGGTYTVTTLVGSVVQPTCFDIYSTNITFGCGLNADYSFNALSAYEYEFTAAETYTSNGYSTIWTIFDAGSNLVASYLNVDFISHTFASAGSHTVVLSVDDLNDPFCDDQVQYVFDVAACNLNADFSIVDIGGGTVYFTSLYPLPLTTSTWSLDGTMYYTFDISHTFLSSGSYNIIHTLTSTYDPSCYDMVTTNIGVTSSYCELDNGSLDFMWTDLGNNEYQFATVNSYSSSNWYIEWSFGDGATDITSQDMLNHTYAAQGSYQVGCYVISVWNQSCWDYIEKTLVTSSANMCYTATSYGAVNDAAVTGTTTAVDSEHWYSFTVPANFNAMVRVTLAGSSFDTYLALYDDCANYNGVNPGTGSLEGAFAVNDDLYDNTSLLYVPLPPGTYYALVYGETALDFGDYTLNITSFDACNDLSYGDVDDPLVTGSIDYAWDLVVWEFTVVSDGLITAQTCGAGTSFDTQLFVFGSCGDINTIMSTGFGPSALYANDDFCGVQSAATGFLTAGTYYVLLMGDVGEFGNYQLEIYSGMPQYMNACNNVISYGDANDPIVYGTTYESFSYDIYSFEVPQGNVDEVFIETCGPGTYFNTRLAVFDNCTDWDGSYITNSMPGGSILNNDDGCGSGLSSSVSDYLSAGTYYVLVYGNDGDDGAYQLEIYTTSSCSLAVDYTSSAIGNCSYEVTANMAYYSNFAYDVEWYVGGQLYATNVDIININSNMSGNMAVELVVTDPSIPGCTDSYSSQVIFNCPCTVDAEFSAVDLGDLDFNFSSLTAYDPLMYNLYWDFGDGSTQTGVNTTYHTFPAIGYYLVSLTVEDPVILGCYDIYWTQVYAFDCYADASYSYNDYGNGTVDFYTDNQFSLNDYAIDWYFGDGTSAYDMHSVTHTYAQTGTYTVECWVTSLWELSCYDYMTQTLYFHVCTVEADFTSTENTYAGSGNYTFESNTAFNANDYSIVWDFGDGSGDSGDDMTTHQYAQTGQYTVSLLVTDLNDLLCFDQVSMVLGVTVLTCDLNIDFTETSNCLDFNFETNMFYDPVTYDISWNFGDGAVDIGGNYLVSHSYAAQGNYDVTLTITHKVLPNCTQTVSYQVFADDCIIDWSYTNTGVSHSILIPATADLNVLGGSITTGDYIGVFFDDNGSMVCGGYVIWQGVNSILTAWGDDVQASSPNKDGFDAGETFTWKIWQATSNTEEVVIADYMAIGQFGITHEDEFSNNGLSGIEGLGAGIATPDVQTLTLNFGWSMISTYIIPTDATCEAVFGAISSQIQILKDEGGSTYWPLFGVNNIGSITIGEGYQIAMISYQTINVVGTAVAPEAFSVDLPSGWSMFGYLRQSPQSIAIALSSVVAPAYTPGDLVIVKDGTGNQYWPYWGVNSIGDMMPGKGYQVRMNANRSFYYQANGPANTAKTNVLPSPSHYGEVENTGSNMSLLIPNSAWSFNVNINDELAIIGDDGNMIGSAVYGGENLGITIWGDNELTVEQDGIMEGESFSIRYFDIDRASEVTLEVLSWIEGGNIYSDNGISVVEKFAAPELLANDEQLYQNWPNPFKEQTTIRYYMPIDGNVHIAIYNALGEMMEVVLDGKVLSGDHEVVFNANNYASGKYYYRMTTDRNSATKAMTISN